MYRRYPIWLVMIVSTFICTGCLAQGGSSERTKAEQRPDTQQAATVFANAIGEQKGSVVLGCPTENSVAFSLLSDSDADVVLVYGIEGKRLPREGHKLHLAAGVPSKVTIEGLTANAKYEYAVLDIKDGRRLMPADRNGFFHTARGSGQSFKFIIQADSHMDSSCRPEVYRRTLTDIAAESADFLIDLGDTFMTEKHISSAEADKQYAAQHKYLGLAGRTTPVYLVPGNHDGEGGNRRWQDMNESMGTWAQKTRSKYFATPSQGRFYTGNVTRSDSGGLAADYYAWEWGDALFIVLNPYAASQPTKGGREPWNMTLGKAQYDWLAQTLAKSSARFKFVFVHQLTGSYHRAGRGGAEAAAYQEWGGKDIDGNDTFAKNRPGWQVPIHRLLVANGVAAVFHGHDHFYARQSLDGIVYQLVPQPSNPSGNTHAAEYGYRDGVFLPGPGYMCVTVEANRASAEYIHTSSDSTDKRRTVGDSYYLYPQSGGRK